MNNSTDPEASCSTPHTARPGRQLVWGSADSHHMDCGPLSSPGNTGATSRDTCRILHGSQSAQNLTKQGASFLLFIR